MTAVANRHRLGWQRAVVPWLLAAWQLHAPQPPLGAEGKHELREPATVNLPGGAATIDDASADAFGFPAPGLTGVERRAFAVGNSFFRQNWVEAPSSTAARDGLGPLFNARSCSACHAKDGRSRPPEAGEPNREGLLVRIGVRAPGAPDAPHPVYGTQVQDGAVLGVQPEASVDLRWEPSAGEYGDGTPFELVAPRYALEDLAYGPLGEDAVLGGRTAPQLVGLGLLEAVPDAAILAHADPDDRDGDGISGRVHWLPAAGEGPPRVGRFGWKATRPDVLSQTASAFVEDLGITSRVFPREALTGPQGESVRSTSGGSPEITDASLDRVVFYVRALAVPAARDPERPDVVRGRALFGSMGCGACHVPALSTGEAAFHPSYERQSIAPYTDLLLHDMGTGLADAKRDGDAAPEEWRTPPLWGVGLVPVVNGHSRYLHDGRARNLAEAVLWHGGEARAARERFRRATREERDALLAFVASL